MDWVTEIATILRRSVAREGVISFARFMETALYCPNLGYYERTADQVGRGGDFYTSVSSGPLFGALLAAHCVAGLRTLGGSGPWHLVEAGGHDGQLAHDILGALEARHPDWRDHVHYWLIEPSLQRQNRQRLKLEKFAPRVEWFASFADLPPGGVRGVILSNELLDAIPVHVLAWDALRHTWFEWGVALEGDGFAWRRLDTDRDWAAALAGAGFELPDALLAVLPDGFVLELAPGAADWWGQAARALRQGWLLTFDYGLTALERLDPGRAQGTLRAYAGHRLVPDVLANPGGQDLTAPINFTQLQRAGEAAGLRTEGLFTQAEFLTRILTRGIPPGWADASSPWTPAEVRQFQALTHPDHLGRAFRVLVQGRSEA